MIKRFKSSKKVWTDYAGYLMERGEVESARNLLQRSLKSLEKRKRKYWDAQMRPKSLAMMLLFVREISSALPAIFACWVSYFILFVLIVDIETITKFALLEFKYGEPERGRTLLDNILTSYPKRTDIWSMYVDVLIRSGDFTAARLVFEFVAVSIMKLNTTIKICWRAAKIWCKSIYFVNFTCCV